MAIRTKKTWVMGDIHGQFSAFQQCIQRSGFDLAHDTLIQLGDVSDRGPDTALVVEQLLSMPKLIAIRGNHDEWTMQWINSGEVHPDWEANGGQQTIESYWRTKGKISREAHQRFFAETQRDFHVDHQKRIFVHGGFTHPMGPAHDSSPTNCRRDRHLWNVALHRKVNPSAPKLLTHFKEIYIGHTPTLNWETTKPMQALNVWNLDTGAGAEGRLTIMDIDTKEYWQSDFVAGAH